MSSFFMFIYFQWIDKGYFINQYLTVLESKDGRNLMTAFGVSQSQFDEILTLASSMTALDIAVQFFVSNAFIAIFLSLVIAVTIKKQNAVN